MSATSTLLGATMDRFRVPFIIVDNALKYQYWSRHFQWIKSLKKVGFYSNSKWLTDPALK